MSVITFLDYVPIPRYDERPWESVRIEEAPLQAGPWTPIDTQAITPVDVDPAHPGPQSFTTEFATLDDGWYRLVFIDSTGDEEDATEPIHNTGDGSQVFMPLVRDVAALILSRTKDNQGEELGTFTNNTRPKFEQVEELIQQAADDVTAGVDTDIPESAQRYVKQLIALRTAMMIERSYFPEQINSNRSSYSQLEKDYDRVYERVQRGIEREAQEALTGEQGLTNRPAYSFPLPDLRYRLGRPL